MEPILAAKSAAAAVTPTAAPDPAASSDPPVAADAAAAPATDAVAAPATDAVAAAAAAADAVTDAAAAADAVAAATADAATAAAADAATAAAAAADAATAAAAAADAARGSRISGFYRLSAARRRELLGWQGAELPIEIADRMSENVIGRHSLPLSVALNFRLNGRDVIVPMAVEEPSVVAAASRAALRVRAGGGFTAEADPPIMTAQVQLDAVPDPAGAAARLAACRDEILAIGNAAIPSMVARGGGCRDLELRVLDAAGGMVVVDLHVHVGDAMGANLVDTVAEATAPALAARLGGRIGLRILTNLPLRRRVRVRASVPVAELGGRSGATGVVRATRFAELDPMRAVTHNKGIMNGIDAAAVALGQDWRAIEAGAHAFAALGGRYRPLSSWRIEGDALVGRLELPLAVGTVGGATGVHPGVRAALALTGVKSAGELATVLAAAGLASNLAALHALAGEGIQRGHMRLHRRRLEAAAPEGAACQGGRDALVG